MWFRDRTLPPPSPLGPRSNGGLACGVQRIEQEAPAFARIVLVLIFHHHSLELGHPYGLSEEFRVRDESAAQRNPVAIRHVPVLAVDQMQDGGDAQFRQRAKHAEGDAACFFDLESDAGIE